VARPGATKLRNRALRYSNIEIFTVFYTANRRMEIISKSITLHHNADPRSQPTCRPGPTPSAAFVSPRLRLPRQAYAIRFCTAAAHIRRKTTGAKKRRVDQIDCKVLQAHLSQLLFCKVSFPCMHQEKNGVGTCVGISDCRGTEASST
jgi:hypothetical protein